MYVKKREEGGRSEMPDRFRASFKVARGRGSWPGEHMEHNLDLSEYGSAIHTNRLATLIARGLDPLVQVRGN